MKLDKNIGLRIVCIGILTLIFLNDFLPTSESLFNFLSPTLHMYNVDFYAYYRGGRAFLSGLDPYTGTRDGQLFIYPPTFIPLYAQIAKMDYETARHLWVWIYSICFLLALVMVLSRIRPEERYKFFFLHRFYFFIILSG